MRIVLAFIALFQLLSPTTCYDQIYEQLLSDDISKALHDESVKAGIELADKWRTHDINNDDDLNKYLKSIAYKTSITLDNIIAKRIETLDKLNVSEEMNGRKDSEYYLDLGIMQRLISSYQRTFVIEKARQIANGIANNGNITFMADERINSLLNSITKPLEEESGEKLYISNNEIRPRFAKHHHCISLCNLNKNVKKFITNSWKNIFNSNKKKSTKKKATKTDELLKNKEHVEKNLVGKSVVTTNGCSTDSMETGNDNGIGSVCGNPSIVHSMNLYDEEYKKTINEQIKNSKDKFYNRISTIDFSKSPSHHRDSSVLHKNTYESGFLEIPEFQGSKEHYTKSSNEYKDSRKGYEPNYNRKSKINIDNSQDGIDDSKSPAFDQSYKLYEYSRKVHEPNQGPSINSVNGYYKDRNSLGLGDKSISSEFDKLNEYGTNFDKLYQYSQKQYEVNDKTHYGEKSLFKNDHKGNYHVSIDDSNIRGLEDNGIYSKFKGSNEYYKNMQDKLQDIRKGLFDTADEKHYDGNSNVLYDFDNKLHHQIKRKGMNQIDKTHEYNFLHEYTITKLPKQTSKTILYETSHVFDPDGNNNFQYQGKSRLSSAINNDKQYISNHRWIHSGKLTGAFNIPSGQEGDLL